MSWDVLIMSEQYDLEKPDNPKNDKIKPLGERNLIIEKLKAGIPQLDYTDKSWGILENEEFSIEFNTGKQEIVDSIMLHIRGAGKVMTTIEQIGKILDAYALDCSSGEYLHFEHVENDESSWEKFQEYRDHVINNLEI